MSQTSNPLIPSLIVSIDVASDKCTVAILKADKSVLLKPLDFDNGLTGFEWLETQINRFANSAAETLIGLEATARYWENLYHYFAAKGYQLVLLHPAQTHQWANRRGLRAKTDKLDALTIGRLLLSEEARPAYVPEDLIASYRELVRLHSRLSEEAARYKVEIRDLLVVLFPEFSQVFADPTSKTALGLLKVYPTAQRVLEAGVEAVQGELQKLSPRKYGLETAQKLVALATRTAASGLARTARSKSLLILVDQLSHTQENMFELEEELAKWLELDGGAQALEKVAEFGQKTVAVIRAELGDVQRFENRDQVVAYAGLDLTVRESGRSKGQAKISKRGSGHLRRVLFMAALGSLRRKDSAFKAYYEAMVARGLKGRKALMAVMRKMLSVAYSLLKYGGTYDPKKVWAAPQSLPL